MKITLFSLFLVALSLPCLAAPPQKILLVAASEANFTAKALNALGIQAERIPSGEFRHISPFNYDLIIWGMDEERSVLDANPAQLDAFLSSGGVFLGFRRNGGDPWLPVPVSRDKAYEFGEILVPDHPIFNTPHKFTTESMRQVHAGSIYDAFCDLGPGWIGLVSTGKEQNWDKRAQAKPDAPHYGIVELPRGQGRVVLVQMIPAYHWFNDTSGDATSVGARLFENMVRYVMAQAPAKASTRPPRIMPDQFVTDLSQILATPKRHAGLPMGDGKWAYENEGPYTMQTDRRGVITLTHDDEPSRAGSYAQVTRTIPVPDQFTRATLRWYESDTYCGGREQVLGGADHGKTALQNFKKDMRYAQVLVNGQVVWEQDVLGRNPQPARDRVRMADVTDAIRAAGGECKVTLRVEDRGSSGEEPFAIDVYWATVDLITDLVQLPADQAFEPSGFEKAEDGALRLAGSAGELTHAFSGPKGEYVAALQLRDEVDGRSKIRLLAGDQAIGEWDLTADDYSIYWAITAPVSLEPGVTLRVQAVAGGDERPLISQLALVPVRLTAKKPDPAVPPHLVKVPHVKFPLIIDETAGISRTGEVTAQGVPFPYGCLTDPRQARLTNADGVSVALQVRPIAKWPDGSIKSALLAFRADVPAKGRTVYTVEAGEGVPMAAVPTGLKLTEQDETITIETGAITVTVSKTNGRIVDEVRRGDEIVKPADEVWDLALEDENGRVVRSGGQTVTDTRIVDAGPMRALIVRKGAFMDADGKLVDFRLQLEATAGSDALGLESIIVNREDSPEVYLKRWSMRLERPQTSGGSVWLSEDECRAANEGAVLYQHLEDLATWTGTQGAVSRGELRTPGIVRLPGVAVGARWFWQRFPQAIRFGADDCVFDFIPQAFDDGDLPTRWCDRMKEMTDKYTVGGVGYPQSPGKMGLFRLAQGEALHQELRFVFDGKPTDAEVASAFAPLSSRLRAIPDPAYTASTHAFMQFHPTDPQRYPRYEPAVSSMYTGYLAKRERRREYGFENFGDDTFEWGYGPSYTYWSNSEYDHHHGFAIQYLRSTDNRWWELAEQQARMYRDIVVTHHAPPGSSLLGGPKHHNATSVWMPSHDEQCWVADHTSAGASAGHSWVEGMIDYWLLTGDPWSEEVVHELAGWYTSIAEQNRFGAGGQERGPGWALIAISALANALYEEPITQAGWIVANWIADWQDPIRGVVSVPISEQPSYEGGSTFMHGIVGRGLGRWYDYTGDPAVREACIGIAEWITTEPMGEPGQFWYKQSPQNSKRYGATDQCMTALSYAYQLTDDPWFLTTSLALFDQTGPGSRSISWYPQSLAHLAPALEPARVSVTPQTVVASPKEAAEVKVSVRNTVEHPVKVQVGARGPRTVLVIAPQEFTIQPGESTETPLKINLLPGAPGVVIQIMTTLTEPDGKQTVREVPVTIHAVDDLVRIDMTAADAKLTAPMGSVEDGDETYVHSPRGPDFSGSPLPEDGKTGGIAQWTIPVPRDGSYRLMAEVYYPDGKGNSFFIGVGDGAEAVLGNSDRYGEWFWTEGPALDLRSGPVTVSIRAREEGARVRRIRLTNFVGEQ